MAETTISAKNVSDVARFIQQLVTANNSEIDVSEGSALYDQTVNALAYIVAFLIKQENSIKNSQSLLTLSRLTEDDNVIEAADAILANWFLQRGPGTFAKGVAQVHLSQRIDLTIRASARFLKTSNLTYFIDAATAITVPQTSLRPTIDTTGTVVDWIASVPLTASRVGSEFNQLVPGRFIGFDRFNAFITFIEHQSAITGGTSKQNTSNFIAQSQNAISIRALINSRSNQITLQTLFPVIEKITSIGMGDPEMFRDLISEISTGIKLHIGGHADVYSRLPLQEVTETLVIGSSFLRNDNRIVVLKDNSQNFLTLGVVPSDILFVAQGLPEAPFQYVIREVTAHTISISLRTPFSLATDEDNSFGSILYTIGNNAPSFNNKVAGTAGEAVSADVGTTRIISRSGVVFLQPRPVYKVKQVEILDVPTRIQSYINTTTNSILFNPRINKENSIAVPGRNLTYQVTCENSSEGQTSLSMFGIDIGYLGHTFDGLLLNVTYDSVAQFDPVSSFVTSSENRIICANSLVRGLHTVYLTFQVPYSLTVDPGILRLTTLPTFDVDAAATSLENFINTYSLDDELDYSLLATQARNISALLGSIASFPIEYSLFAPNGKVYKYSTTDKVTVFADQTNNGAQLLNPTEVGLPIKDYEILLKEQLNQLGISHRTLRYACSNDSITFVRRL